MAKLNIYLAGRYGRREELRGYADQLRAIGHTVTSCWLDTEHEAFDAKPTREQMLDWAEDDLSDINDADIFIAFTELPNSPHSRGGRHVEFGYALALRKATIHIGPPENIFYSQAQCAFRSFDSFFALLQEPDFEEKFL